MLVLPLEDTNDEQLLDNEQGASRQPSLEHHQNHALPLVPSNDEANLDSQNELYRGRSVLRPEVHWKLSAYQLVAQGPTQDEVDGGRIFHWHLNGQMVALD